MKFLDILLNDKDFILKYKRLDFENKVGKILDRYLMYKLE